MSIESMTTGERRAVTGLAGLYVLRMLGLFMVLPVLSIYSADLEGATPALIGMAIGGYGLTQALLQIPFGFLSDKIGRKTVIVFGLLLFIAGSVVAAMSETIYGVIIGRCLQGSGAIASSLMALLSDLTREQMRMRAMAVVGMSIGISFSVALVLGPLISQPFGLEGLFWFTALLASTGLAVIWKWVPTPQRYDQHRDTGVQKGQLKQIVRHPELLRLDFGIFILHLVMTATFVVVPLRMVELGLATANHWMVYLPIMILSFLAMVPFIIVAEKKRKMKPIFIFAIGLVAASQLLMGGLTAESRNALFILLFLYFMAFNLLEASLPSLVSKISPAGQKGAAMGVYSSSQFLGAFVGGAAGGWVYGEWGIDAVLMACGLLALLWALVVLPMAPPKHLTGKAVSLPEHWAQDTEGFIKRLLALPGVEEVVVITDEKAAYMKIDKAHFDDQALAAAIT
ncbi:MFS transporter [Oceanospirillum sp. HFRX-1_2]